MSGLAHWTPSPRDEREIVAEARHLGNAVWRARLSFAALVAWTVLAAFLPGDSGLAGPVFLALTLNALYTHFRGSSERKSVRDARWRRDAVTIDELGAQVGWLVELIVHHGDAPLGADRGMMWIEDGRLYFSGRRTSFGLTADGVGGPCEMLRAVPGLRHSLRLPLRGPNATISFKIVRPAKWQMAMREGEIARTIDGWRAESSARGGQLPPLMAGPGALSTAHILSRAILVVSYWPALAGLCWALGRVDDALGTVALLVGLAVGGASPSLSSPLLLLRAYRDVRRLRR